MASKYHETYAEWSKDHEAFWAKAAGEIDFYTPYEKVFDAEAGVYGRWFTGATCNLCYNCVDRHVERGRQGQAALIYDSPITGHKQTLTYAELKRETEVFAAVLQDHGVQKGDRVIIYMPMIPLAVISMLATVRIGAIHSVVFGGFAPRELATRIDDCQPKVIVAGSCGIEPGRLVPYKPLLDEAIELSTHKPDHCLVFQREQHPANLGQARDVDLGDALEAARNSGREVPCVPVLATDPSYLLYTSGTTGQPKGVLRDTGGHMVALKWSMSAIYGIKPGEVFWAASDVGWVVGHSYIAFGPLLHGCTSIVFEGKPIGTPDAGAFWRVCSEYDVVSLFTAPTAFRVIKKEDPKGEFLQKYDLSHFRTLFLAGERADPDTIQWAENQLNVPVIDHWWQTETGWPMACNPIGLGALEVKHGSPAVSMPGYKIEVVSDEGEPMEAGTLGNIVVKLPLPPGCLPTLWNNDDRFKEAYLSEFPGYYKTADAGYIDDEGYLYIMARTDDIINTAGHRLSTGAMEEVVSEHQAIAECAVIGVADEIKGQVPVGFFVTKTGVNMTPEQIEKELIAMVREKIGPVAAFKRAVQVARLPKTRSGKILRATMRKIADGEDYAIPATIDDPDILKEISDVLST